MTHGFVSDGKGGCDDCGRPQQSSVHTDTTGEPYTPPDFLPLLPEDGIDYMTTPCDVCGVKSGSCLSRAGYYRPAHPSRLEKAQLRAAS